MVLFQVCFSAKEVFLKFIYLFSGVGLYLGFMHARPVLYPSAIALDPTSYLHMIFTLSFSLFPLSFCISFILFLNLSFFQTFPHVHIIN